MSKTALTSIIAASLISLYAATGFFLLPYLAKTALQQQMQHRYAVNASVKNISFHPFLFQAKIQNLQLIHEQKELLALQSFTIDLSPWALLQKTVAIQKLDIKGLILHATLDANSRLNFLSVFQSRKNENTTQNTRQTPWKITLDKGEISQTYLTFTDNARHVPYTQSIGPLDLHVNNVSFTPGVQSDYTARFDLDTFGTLTLNGNLRPVPLAATARIDWRDMKLRALKDLLPNLPVTPQAGTAWLQTRAMLRSDGRFFLQLPAVDAGLHRPRLLMDGKKIFGSKEVNFTAKDLRMQFGKRFGLQSNHASLQAQNPTFYDQFLQKAFAHDFDKAEIKLRDFSINQDFNLAATLQKQQEMIAVKARTNLQNPHLEAQLQTQNLDLSRYNAYIQPYANLRIHNAHLQSQSDITLDQNNTLRLHGDAAVEDIDINSGQLPLLRAKSLEIQGFSYKPNIVALQKLSLQTPMLHLRKSSAGLNAAKLLKRREQNNSASNKASMSFALQETAVTNAGIRYIDNTTQPESILNLHALDLNASLIQRGVRSDFSLHSQVGDYGVISAKASADVFDPLQDFSAEGKVEGFNLQPLSAYSTNTLGRKLLQGRMDLDFDYTVANRQLEAVNNVLIRHLQVSDHLPRSKAKRVPMNLAIALLQDRNKVIDLDIDISNDLSAPDFSVRNLIPTVLANVITKAAASPFSMLANLVGFDGDKLAFSRFDPGSYKLNKAQKQKLDALVSALIRRPGLQLRLRGGYDEQQDAAALKQELLEQKLREMKLASLAEKLEVSPAKDNNTTTPHQALRQAVVDKLPLPSGSLENLARQRMQAVQAYLQASNIEAKRITTQKQLQNDTRKVTFALQTR